MLCSNHGAYVGGSCQSNAEWKCIECLVRWMSEWGLTAPHMDSVWRGNACASEDIRENSAIKVSAVHRKYHDTRNA